MTNMLNFTVNIFHPKTKTPSTKTELVPSFIMIFSDYCPTILCYCNEFTIGFNKL